MGSQTGSILFYLWAFELLFSLGNAFLSFVYLVKSTHFLKLNPNGESFPICPRPWASLFPKSFMFDSSVVLIIFNVSIYLPG